VEAVVAFADNVLKKGRDRWSGKDTPLLADGVNVDTGEPVEWVFAGKRWIVSNLASQQDLFRTLTGLSRLTGEPRYRAAAEAATRYHLDHLRHNSGLLFWGGHRFIDLRTLKVVGEQNSHEFKCSYPYYDLLWELDPNAAERFIKALWNAHVLDWSKLDMNRHGIYERPMGNLWASRFVGAEPFFEGKGLTFINCGSDLVYAAGLLYAYTGDTGALAWSKRLAEQYVRARDPRTGLGAYQFSQAKRERAPTNDRNTGSDLGDRAKRQLGPEFGERALEGRVLDPGRATTIYGRVAISQLHVNTNTSCADPLALFGLLEILRISKNDAYLELARRIGDNIVAARFHKGFFVPDAKRVNACFYALEPLALLALEAHLRGMPDVVPAYAGGRGYIHGPHDGLGRTYDRQAIWSQTRKAAGESLPKTPS
jgi:pectate lyase